MRIEDTLKSLTAFSMKMVAPVNCQTLIDITYYNAKHANPGHVKDIA